MGEVQGETLAGMGRTWKLHTEEPQPASEFEHRMPCRLCTVCVMYNCHHIQKKEDLLKNVSVELQLAVSQELSNHLSAQALPLQQEVSHSNGRVWDETTCDQEVDASFWVPARSSQQQKG